MSVKAKENSLNFETSQEVEGMEILFSFCYKIKNSKIKIQTF